MDLWHARAILWQWGLCEYVMVHTILGGSPVILWISLGGKPKWLPLKFGYHDVMRTSCSHRKKLATRHSRLSHLGVAPSTIGMSTSIRQQIRLSYVNSSREVISRDIFLCDSSLFC